MRRIRHPTLTRFILRQLAEIGAVSLDAFFPAKYPQARLWRKLLGLDPTYQFKRQTFSTLLARLRADGLVARSDAKRRNIWHITNRGRRLIGKRQAWESAHARDGIKRLVIFDIPERERRKRDAVRLDLVAAGYVQLQKSVWYGEQPLPEDFITLVDELRLRSCVHIFSVRKEGTLAKAN